MALTRILMMTLPFVHLARLEMVSSGVEGVGKGKGRVVHRLVHVGNGQRSRRWRWQKQQMVRHLAMALTRILMMMLAFVHVARLELVAAGVSPAGVESVRGRRLRQEFLRSGLVLNVRLPS